MSILTRAQPQYSFGDVRLSKEIKIADVVKYFDLDAWEAVKHPNMRVNGLPVGDSYHILRESKVPAEFPNYHTHVLNKLVSESYTILQYKAGLDKMFPLVAERMLDISSASMFGNGTKFGCLFDIADEISGTVENDTISRHLLLALSHGSGYRGLFFTDIVPVCENTLAQAVLQSIREKGKSFTLGQDDPDQNLTKGIQLLDLTRTAFHEKALPLYKAYSNLTLEKGQIEYVFRTLLNMPLEVPARSLSDSMIEKYERLYDSYHMSPGQEDRKPGTGWSVYNAITHFTHSIGASSERQYEANLLGSGGLVRKQGQELLNSLLPAKHIAV